VGDAAEGSDEHGDDGADGEDHGQSHANETSGTHCEGLLSRR
jgi:hypothetical protein